MTSNSMSYHDDVVSDYLIIGKSLNKKGEDTMVLKEHSGQLIIKQYSGINTDNFVIKKFDGKQIAFSFFKINGIRYLNINGENIINYNKFINIQQVVKLETKDDELPGIKITNGFYGNMIIYNCDVEIFSKALSVMNKYMKNNKSSFVTEIMNFLNN